VWLLGWFIEDLEVCGRGEAHWKFFFFFFFGVVVGWRGLG